jgi:hypothetical protein
MVTCWPERESRMVRVRAASFNFRGVEHRHDPAAVDGIRQVAKVRLRRSQEPDLAFLRKKAR